MKGNSSSRSDIKGISTKNARGRKTRNPGWKPGDHWVSCDRCSCDIRASDAKMTWDNLIVCPDDWEPRHPQDFVRGRQDSINAKEPIRPEPTEIFVETNRLPPSSVRPPNTFPPEL